MFLALLFAVLPSAFAANAPDIQLAPIVREESAAEALSQDPVLPEQSGEPEIWSGTGSVQRSLQQSLPVTFTDRGQPQAASQIRGLAPSAQDVDVQAFGVSLNPPQGGGYDLSIFPQYLWSGYGFQAGPSLGAFNPTAVSGTLTLTPWTAVAIANPGQRRFRGSEFYSSLGLNQVSAAASEGRVAALAGYTSGSAFGPSGSVSARWQTSRLDLRAHFLGTSLDNTAAGPTYMPSPLARQRTSRVIPVLQMGYRLSDDTELRSSVFYDGAELAYSDPSIGAAASTLDYSQQLGTENALLLGSWRFGASVRQVAYKASYFEAPRQSQVNLQISKSIDLGQWLVEPTLQTIWISQYPVGPQGSLGIRREWDKGDWAVFGRASYARKYPSLLDRYYSYGTFVGNPDVLTEQAWTSILGVERRSSLFEVSVQTYLQYRQDARVVTATTVTNVGNGRIAAMMTNVNYRPWGWLTLSNAWVASASQLSATGLEFPYTPALTTVFSTSFHATGDLPTWEIRPGLRAASSAEAEPGTGLRVGAYALLDLMARVRIWRSLHATAGVENLLGQPVEVTRGYPIQRSASLGLCGEI